MQNFLIYILEVSILTSIFFLFYRYLYFKLAYFVWSRYFFYLILFVSIIIPLLPEIFNADILKYKIESIIRVSETGNNTFINIENSFLNNEKSFLDNIKITEILFIVWLSGFVRYTFIILKSIFAIIKIKSKGEIIKDGDFNIIKTSTNSPAFSFFNDIFVNKDFEKLNDAEKNQITTHEKIHAKQKHTIDNIIFEIFRAVFWFNPISRLISANIKIIHEFIVDNKITGNKNVPDYSKLIIKLATHQSHGITISSFSKEEITNRIKLITFPETEKIRKKRFAISIPVLLITILTTWIISSTINTYAINKQENQNKFHLPFEKGTFKIISPYFENRKFKNLKISHKETSYELKSFSNIFSVEAGKITNIEEKDIFGLKEITITEKLKDGYTIKYKGLYKTTVMKGDKIGKAKIIGQSGDIRLYPKIDIELLKDAKTIDPENFY